MIRWSGAVALSTSSRSLEASLDAEIIADHHVGLMTEL
jgi:hypothetical protein